MLNHTVIMGRLTRDPELRRTATGTAVASFTLATERDFSGKDGGEKETDFIDCVAWRQTGEFAAKHFTKGRMAVVSGRLQIRSWTDKDGNKRRTAEVVADNIYFADSKPSGSTQAQNSGQPAYTAPAEKSVSTYTQSGFAGYSAPATAVSEFAMLDDDDGQLPF